MSRTNSVRIGLVDSGYGHPGISPVDGNRVSDQAGFIWQDDQVQQVDTCCDKLGHGSALLRVIADQAPLAMFAVAQIFRDRLTTTPAQVAAAIDWLVMQDVAVINLSLGLRNDRDVLREACERALSAGVIICASTPARGEPVYPAAYPDVFRMTGDARCAINEISSLQTRYADFGAYVQAEAGVVGASAGCAQLSGHIGRYLSEGGDNSIEAVTQWLEAQARYFGAEVRFPEKNGEQTGQGETP
ncbi:MAG: peptidase S8/S53 subtilisin kexin sedolisin [Amphritea sp.]|nr:peptidase S8/S53 subtilisin kexin sedolisin [Amphritea sp.]